MYQSRVGRAAPAYITGDVQWGPAPGFLPAGAEIAVLDGDPAAAAQLTLRLRFPAGYEIPAHWHPTQENVTVISGTIYAGLGDVLDKANGGALEPGGYVALPAEMNHFAWTEQETVIQVDIDRPVRVHLRQPRGRPQEPVNAE